MVKCQIKTSGRSMLHCMFRVYGKKKVFTVSSLSLSGASMCVLFALQLKVVLDGIHVGVSRSESDRILVKDGENRADVYSTFLMREARRNK